MNSWIWSPITCLRVAFIVFCAAPACSQDLRVSFDKKNSGDYTIHLDGQAWLHGSHYQVLGWSTSDGSLVQIGHANNATGQDAFGKYSAISLSWGSSDSPRKVLMRTSFRTYPEDNGLVVFEQYFPEELPGMKDDNKDACRIVTSKTFQLTASVSGYSAYTPSQRKRNIIRGRQYTEHGSKYCDDGHKWAYTGNLNLTACAARCDSLNCTCFDVRSTVEKLAAKTVFPSFDRSATTAGIDLSCYSYHGTFPKMKSCLLSSYKESHQGGAPLTIYDPSNPKLPMVVLSPISYPKAHHMASSTAFVGAGIKATVQTIPAGWSQTFLLSAGYGINAGTMKWGERLLKFTGKQRADMYLDDVHSTIGFWTDNGGYYHYSTGDKKYGANYEEVLPKVKAYHDTLKIPFGHWQFDSWFYPKDGGVNPGGGGGAVTNWTALPSVFPHGMAYIQSKLQVPMVMHNRQWSTKSDYIKNLPFKWYTSKSAVPENPEAFFTWFFKQQEGWGLKMYEQDWMDKEYDSVDALQTNITMADLWLQGMATGAASSNRSIQYCMPYPNDLLSGAHHTAVTNARATGDYFHAFDQWAIGATGLFYWSIGILPFKDGFYSSNLKQTGGQTVGPEKNPDREALMATLSTAMVGPMDGIELLNATRVMATCRGDGVVLKPDKPVTTIDHCFTDTSRSPESCYLYHTYSDISGLGRVNYFYSDSADVILTPDMIYVNDWDSGNVSYAVYNWYSGKVQMLQGNQTIAAGYENHIYATISPVIKVAQERWVLVGERKKYVTTSRIRFANVAPAKNGNGFSVDVTGASNEDVEACAVNMAVDTFVCQSIKFNEAGLKNVIFAL